MSQPRRPTADLIHRYRAVGKTTFAKRLAAATGAVRFSLDQWYLRLYTASGATAHLDDDFLRRLRSPLDARSPQLLASGLDVVLDFEFWSRQDRTRALAESVGSTAGVVDWSAAGIGDPACEAMLARAMAPQARTRYRAALNIDDPTWARGRGWTIEQAAHVISYYKRTIPIDVAAARERLEAVLTDG